MNTMNDYVTSIPPCVTHTPTLYYSTNRATMGEQMFDCEECGCRVTESGESLC